MLQAYQVQNPQSKPIDIFDGAFPEQIAFIKDSAKLKALFCTRRAAKSYTAGLYMVKEAIENPGCNCLFLGLTRQSAFDIVWKDILTTLNEKFNLGATPHLTQLKWTLPNGSVISVSGVDIDEKEMNKLLGRKYRLVCIDEASMYTIDLNRLVYGILKMATIDPNAHGERGSICMFGTASNFTRGLFYDVTIRKATDWSLHSWTAHDNPYVRKNYQEELEEIDRDRPLFKETPLYKQWYLNQWVADLDKLCYKFNEKKNFFTELPPLFPEGWTYVLGIDLGYEDDTAFVISAFHQNLDKLFFLESFNQKHMELPDVENKIEEFKARYPISRFIIDGSAKQAIETMRTRTKVPFEFADKLGKEAFIGLFNSDLIQEKIKFHQTMCAPVANEMLGLIWDCEGEKIKLPRKEHPALPNHLCDAALYNWRMCFHYHAEPATKVIPIGSKEWYQKQSEDIWEREREHIEKISNGSNDWPNQDGGFGSW